MYETVSSLHSLIKVLHCLFKKYKMKASFIPMQFPPSKETLSQSDAQRILIEAIRSHKAMLVRTPWKHSTDGEALAHYTLQNSSEEVKPMTWPYLSDLDAEKRDRGGKSTYSRRHSWQLHHGGYLFTDFHGNIYYSTLSEIDGYNLGDMLETSWSAPINKESSWQNPYLRWVGEVIFEDPENQAEWDIMANWYKLAHVQDTKTRNLGLGSSVWQVIRRTRNTLLEKGIVG